MDGMTIGQVARESGVGVETVRFYERKGLIDQPERPETGYRRYPRETAARVRFIRNAKDLGFSLREIADLLSLAVAPKTSRREMRARAEAKIREIDARIESLTSLRRRLEGLVSSCRSGAETCACPIVGAFER